ncbi:MAG TPA: hypothetical protein VLH56_11410 [Dissulfurispiraceae bacterium]|nr:hypothetical protein [Dissulfurispiraceae bacterium]
MADYAAILRAIMTQLDRIEEQQKILIQVMTQMHPDPKRWPIPMGPIQPEQLHDEAWADDEDDLSDDGWPMNPSDPPPPRAEKPQAR